MINDVDVAVIGAGIHGAGAAQAAAAAGHSVLIVEKTGPAAGTSSRSSKLIHGGLRYLETLQFDLVRESLQERRLLLRNAPGLVRRVPFLIPVYPHTRRRPWQIGIGLACYAALGGFGADNRFGILSRGERANFAGLRQDGLQAVFTYFDAQTDDARLTRAVLDSAIALGARLLAPARLTHARRATGGYRLAIATPDGMFECRAACVINAAGPWIDRVQALAEPALPPLSIDRVQGTHLIFDRPIADAVFYVEARIDHRPVFVMPWQGGTLIGTTETLFTGDPDAVTPLESEIAYLATTLKDYFPAYDGRLTGTMAGLRVLPRDDTHASHRSRETLLPVDDPARPRWLAIVGGKLTAYRATAAKAMALLAPSLPHRPPVADTRTLRLAVPD
jgi:glycerol-3-phosphate dehydrogenase